MHICCRPGEVLCTFGVCRLLAVPPSWCPVQAGVRVLQHYPIPGSSPSAVLWRCAGSCVAVPPWWEDMAVDGEEHSGRCHSGPQLAINPVEPGHLSMGVQARRPAGGGKALEPPSCYHSVGGNPGSKVACGLCPCQLSPGLLPPPCWAETNSTGCSLGRAFSLSLFEIRGTIGAGP